MVKTSFKTFHDLVVLDPYFWPDCDITRMVEAVSRLLPLGANNKCRHTNVWGGGIKVLARIVYRNIKQEKKAKKNENYRFKK